MGGTTTKASIIERGEMLRATEYEVGSAVSVSSRLMRGTGYLMRIPVIDISEVGAGGGSIARLDAGGALRVGPRSAGRGARSGVLRPGQRRADRDRRQPGARISRIANRSPAARCTSIGAPRGRRSQPCRDAPAGMSLHDAAFGIHLVANSNMVRAIKSVSVERGRDPGRVRDDGIRRRGTDPCGWRGGRARHQARC